VKKIMKNRSALSNISYKIYAQFSNYRGRDLTIFDKYKAITTLKLDSTARKKVIPVKIEGDYHFWRNRELPEKSEGIIKNWTRIKWALSKINARIIATKLFLVFLRTVKFQGIPKLIGEFFSIFDEGIQILKVAPKYVANLRTDLERDEIDLKLGLTNWIELQQYLNYHPGYIEIKRGNVSMEHFMMQAHAMIELVNEKPNLTAKAFEKIVKPRIRCDGFLCDTKTGKNIYIEVERNPKNIMEKLRLYQKQLGKSHYWLVFYVPKEVQSYFKNINHPFKDNELEIRYYDYQPHADLMTRTVRRQRVVRQNGN